MEEDDAFFSALSKGSAKVIGETANELAAMEKKLLKEASSYAPEHVRTHLAFLQNGWRKVSVAGSNVDVSSGITDITPNLIEHPDSKYIRPPLN